MTADELIDKLATDGVQLSLNIHVDAPATVDADCLTATIREHKRELIATLAARWLRPPPRATATDCAEIFSDTSTAALEVTDALARDDVPDGWDRGRWVARLQYLAGVCTQPARGKVLLAWAARVAAADPRGGEGSMQ